MSKLQIVTLDFETFYGQGYSLTSKELNTSQYVRHPLFKAHCVSIKLGTKPSKCYAGADIDKALKAIDWSKSALVCHNTAFDGLILSHHYGIAPAYYYDTLSMTRGLHAEVSRAKLDTIARLYGLGSKHEGALENTYGKRDLDPASLKRLMEYCDNDNELCYRIFRKQLEVFPQNELDLIDLTMRMFCDPILVLDEERARKAHKWEVQERLRTIAYSGVTEKVLNSAEQFANALRALDVDPPTKISKTTNEVTYAFAQTDQEFLDLEQHEDIRVVRLVQGRLAAKSKLNETRAERMLKDGANGQKLPVLLNYWGAKTGRWSGGNKVNMQNLPRIERDDAGNPLENTGELRQSLLAPEGHVIVVCDSAQIEARVLAWLAGQQDIIDAFAKNEDVYARMASGIYGRQIDKKKDPLERFIGKIAVLGLGYGMGHRKFQTTLALGIMGPPVDLPLEQCNQIVKGYRKTNAAIAKLWEEANTVLKNMILGKEGVVRGLLEYDAETIWLPSGMGLNYPALKAKVNENNGLGDISYLSNGKRTKIYGGLLVENWVQALARIIVGEQMLWIQTELNKLRLKKGERARAVLMTHDEVVSVVPARYAEKVQDMKIKLMRVCPAWCQGLPLNAEGGFAREYSK